MDDGPLYDDEERDRNYREFLSSFLPGTTGGMVYNEDDDPDFEICGIGQPDAFGDMDSGGGGGGTGEDATRQEETEKKADDGGDTTTAPAVETGRLVSAFVATTDLILAGQPGQQPQPPQQRQQQQSELVSSALPHVSQGVKNNLLAAASRTLKVAAVAASRPAEPRVSTRRSKRRHEQAPERTAAGAAPVPLPPMSPLPPPVILPIGDDVPYEKLFERPQGTTIRAPVGMGLQHSLVFDASQFVQIRKQIAQHAQLIVQVCFMLVSRGEILQAMTAAALLDQLAGCGRITHEYRRMLAYCASGGDQAASMRQAGSIFQVPGIEYAAAMVQRVLSRISKTGASPGPSELGSVAAMIEMNCSGWDPAIKVEPILAPGKYGWLPSEDNLLLLGMEAYNRDWEMIQQRLLPSKTPTQISLRVKSRCQRRVGSNPIQQMNLDTPLTQNEQAVVAQGVKAYGMNWELICQNSLPYRTPNLIRRFWLYGKHASQPAPVAVYTQPGQIVQQQQNVARVQPQSTPEPLPQQMSSLQSSAPQLPTQQEQTTGTTEQPLATPSVAAAAAASQPQTPVATVAAAAAAAQQPFPYSEYLVNQQFELEELSNSNDDD